MTKFKIQAMLLLERSENEFFVIDLLSEEPV
jgi:hypothetical protein